MSGEGGAEELQSLGLADRLYPLILSGEKTHTIRWLEPRIHPGPMQYICDGDAARQVRVRVIRCTDMPLSEAAEFVGRAREWPDNVMLAGMRVHYPAITLDAIVQVIEHTTPLTCAGVRPRSPSPRR